MINMEQLARSTLMPGDVRELSDLKYQIEYLRKVLSNLYYQTQEDALRKTKQLESALDDAAEALGLYDIGDKYEERR